MAPHVDSPSPHLGKNEKLTELALVQMVLLHRVHWSFGELRTMAGKLSSIEELFAGRHFDRQVIILCVRWYLRYKLSFRDLVEMMAERGLSLD